MQIFTKGDLSLQATLKSLALTYCTVLAVLLLADFIWLGWVSQAAYQAALGYLLRNEIKIVPAILFYLMYASAIVYLAVLPSITTFQAMVRGMVLGCAAYGTYNLTNYSIINEWPLNIALSDWLWGIVLTSVSASFATYFVWRKRTN